MTDTISTRVFRKLADLQEIAGFWNDLLERSLNDNLFLTWEWISTWVSNYLSGDDLFVIVVYDDGFPVAIAPLWLERRRTAGMFPVRVLRFLGSSGVCSDYLDVIVQKKGYAKWLDRIWNQLFGDLRSQWDLLEYADTPADSKALAQFHRLADQDDRCLNRQIVNTELCPYMPLPGQVDQLSGSLSRTRRYTINHSRKRLAEQGELQTRTCERLDQIPDALARLKDLNTRSWQERGQPGSFATSEFTKFHSSMAEISLQRDWLLLCSLWSTDRYLGGFYGFAYHGVLYFYIMSEEKSNEKRVNTGDVLLAHCMEEGIRRGCCTFDFLRGDEPYKYRWTESDRRLLSLHIYNRRPAALLTLVFENILRTVKAIARMIWRRKSTDLQTGYRDSVS
ncbi:MAG: GNAT family N-acetyltransferase [Gemmatimonadota bacterium]|nr:MAG: GNAT family N-acetyltransferase [Gemmatimonadota bacterium]